MTPEELFYSKAEKIIESKDRTKAGKTAPAEGLYLVDIKY